jgi:lipopolysaccharide biosynthesis glycosyltransferase
VFNVDVATIFDNDLGNKIFGVVQDEVVPLCKEFYEYVEGFLGVDRYKYFNSGLLLINCEAFNKFQVEIKFIDLMNKFKLEVAPDQDYLNLICKDNVVYLDLGWNKNPINNKEFDNNQIKMVHYKMSYRPWRYDDVLYSDIYWKYASISPFYLDIVKEKQSFTEEDKRMDMQKGANLLLLTKEYLKKGKLEVV